MYTRTQSRAGLRWLALVTLLAFTTFSCIARDIAPREPDQKSSFVTLVRAGAIDKIDLLFAIDNSTSMGDKQAILRDAVPDLLDRLVRPRCIERGGAIVGQYDPRSGCPAGSEPEFRPLRDLHVGIVSSSIGGLGSRACSEAGRHDNDRARLIARTKGNDPAVSESAPRSFLAYLPDVPENEGRPRQPDVVGARPFDDPHALVEAFQRLVVGVGEDGCGYEAQLESVYRFLVQPDPWSEVTRANGGPNALVGMDDVLLAQRRAFLRPDSLVAVVVVTDENESTVDPTALGGDAWRFLEKDPLPPGTAACETAPESDACMSCASAAAASDARCQRVPIAPGDDPNVRFFDVKRRFGLEPRFSRDRYVRGLSDDKVKDRNGRECTNPLFAARIPAGAHEEWCTIERGPRTNNDVLLTIVGGVPWQLLTEKRDDLSRRNAAPLKPALEEDDFTFLLGPKSPSHDFPNAHPLLRESIQPRADVPAGTDWDTQGKQLQYACTFDLPTPRDCGPNDDTCDCAVTTSSPLCDPASPHRQVRGKAYPSLTSLAVARDLGDRAVVGSICPREMSDKKSPDYGYRPVMNALVDRIKDEIRGSCVPRLNPDEDGRVRCMVLELEPQGVTSCDATRGRRPADPEILTHVTEQQGLALGGRTVCAVEQIPLADTTTSCADADAAGYCYVTGPQAPKRCGQAISFSKKGAPLASSTVFLQCIDARVAGR